MLTQKEIDAHPDVQTDRKILAIHERELTLQEFYLKDLQHGLKRVSRNEDDEDCGVECRLDHCMEVFEEAIMVMEHRIKISNKRVANTKSQISRHLTAKEFLKRNAQTMKENEGKELSQQQFKHNYSQSQNYGSIDEVD